jgi:hypothetical protein
LSTNPSNSVRAVLSTSYALGHYEGAGGPAGARAEARRIAARAEDVLVEIALALVEVAVPDVRQFGLFLVPDARHTSQLDVKIHGGCMLAKDRHTNLDLFIADFWVWPIKDDQASMEHPFFSLAKMPDHTERRYEHNGNILEVIPGGRGMPTTGIRPITIAMLMKT